MLRKIYAIVTALVLVSAFSACKTNEKNMSEAYNKAIAGRFDAEEDSTTLVLGVGKLMNHTSLAVGSDSVDITNQFVLVTKNSGATQQSLRKYCVVVGQFKLEFNALEMRKRIAGKGYPDAFVVETTGTDAHYFVVACSFDEAPDAVKAIRKVEKDKQFKFRNPLPFVLQPSQIR